MRDAQQIDLYDLPSVPFVLSGPEASILFNLLGAELRKSNSVAQTAIRVIQDKLGAGASAALMTARKLYAGEPTVDLTADRDGLMLTPEARALAVIVSSPTLRTFLQIADPQALKQAERALGVEV